VLEQIFISLLRQYSNDNALAEQLWSEAETAYSGKNRYYHTLIHLDDLLEQLTNVKEAVNDWDTVLCSLVYHDIVYNPLKKDNEERSALLAEERLKSISFPAGKIEKCKEQILATKTHEHSSDNDTNLFTDADLSILGQSWEVYADYTGKVRKEFSIYPDFIYNSGRKSILHHFIERDRIFKTDEFHNRYEYQARKNIAIELELLS
jgi:predicted metal-dependent HD superfamily phosphohydrolase